MPHVVVLPGDGIGPEVAAPAVAILRQLVPDVTTEEQPFGGAAKVEHLVGERGAVGVDRAAAHQSLLELKLAQGFQQAAGGTDDLGTDPVPGQQDYAR